MTLTLRFPLSVTVFLATLLVGVHAQAASFTDIDDVGELHDAIVHLQARGVLEGYPDGTFRPDKKVNRAEAAKILVTSTKASKHDVEDLKTSAFGDVPSGSWFLPYVEWARLRLKIVDGPPTTERFNPDRPVKKAEFLKMMLLAHKLDTNSYGEIKLPLARDVTDLKAWYYPFVRLAIAMSLTGGGQTGLISPQRDLTRADVALFLYRFDRYRSGEQTQSLLTSDENELLNVLTFLEKKSLAEAEYASARALLTARGAHASNPDSSVTKGALKITEAFRALVRGYRAAQERKFPDAEKLFKDAWTLGQKTIELNKDLTGLAQKVQRLASSMASDARAAKP